MKKEIKIISIAIIILFTLWLILPQIVEARSGCCSWHRGVCSYQCPSGSGVGYRCCDGTSLSAKCAPYYAKCSVIDPRDTAAVSGTQSKEKSYNWIWWVIGIIIIGGIAYHYGKKKKE